MRICKGNNFGSIFLNLLEILLVLMLLILYIKKILIVLKPHQNLFQKMDKILIDISILQLFLLLFQFLKNYYIFDVLFTIFKFCQNIIICSLIFVVVYWKYTSIQNSIINYFLITLLITSVLFLLLEIKSEKIVSTKYCDPLIYKIVSILFFFINLFAAYKSYLFDKEYSNEPRIMNNQNFNENNNDENFIDNMYKDLLNKIQNIMKIYKPILYAFLLSYFIDFLLILFFNKVSYYESYTEININNNNITFNDLTNINPILDKQSNKSVTNGEICDYIRNYNTKFGLINFIGCFIGFLCRDYLPYVFVYFYFFIKKEDRINFFF